MESLSPWRQFLDRLPADHPLRRLVVEAAENTVEDAILRLAAIVESSDDAIISKTLEGRILSWNAAAARVYGYPAEEVIGRNVSLLVAPGRPNDTEEILSRIRQGQGLDHYETTRMRKDGRLIEVSLTVSPIRDASGRVVAASSIGRDITERKRTERRVEFLAHASSVLASSLDYETTLATVARLAVPDLADWCTVDVVDEGGDLRRVAVSQGNPDLEAEARELIERYPQASQRGTIVADAVAAREARLLPEITEAFWTEAARDPHHLDLLRRFRIRSGMVVPLVARGRLLGVLTFALTDGRRPYDSHDLQFGDELGRRAALAMDNARLYSEAQAANRMKDEFLATLSHELRTPLTPILGWTRILRSGRVDPATRERALEVIERNVETQSHLIGDLLDVSRIASGKLRLELRPTEIGAVVESAVETILPTAEARGVVVESRIETTPAIVYADPDRVRQIVWNLLTNAVKFTPRGGCVTVTLRRTGSSVELEVADTGEGIPPEFQPFIFNRFHQADSSTTRKHGGLGLGLAIVRHLVELHGGRVEASSPGRHQGATFTVKLPILAAGTARPAPRALTTKQRDNGGRVPLRGIDRLRVLVVDDERDAREMLTALLESRGALVRGAGSAEEALEQVERWHPDAIVADIGMPGTDGYAMLSELRSRPPDRGGTIPAVALTAYARTQDRERALRAGFQAHLSKPVNPEDLLGTLEQVAGLERSTG